jgi:hypothetical protein
MIIPFKAEAKEPTATLKLKVKETKMPLNHLETNVDSATERLPHPNLLNYLL